MAVVRPASASPAPAEAISSSGLAPTISPVVAAAPVMKALVFSMSRRDRGNFLVRFMSLTFLQFAARPRR